VEGSQLPNAVVYDAAIMLSQHIEGRVLDLVERVVDGARIEDFRVECKAVWPEAAKAARQVAGHANAARGEPILWIVGLGEDAHQVTGASDIELADWWAQVTAIMDEGITPGLTPLVVPVGAGRSVVALYMTTERAPYLVKRQDQQGPFEREVPWRDGNRTRSAYRRELLRLLLAAVAPPEGTVVNLELRAVPRPAVAANAAYRTPAQPEHIELSLWGLVFFGPPGGPPGGPTVVLPAHLMTGQIEVAGDQPGIDPLKPVSAAPTFHRRLGPGGTVSQVIEPHPLGVDVRLGDVYVTGPGTLRMTATGQVSIEQQDTVLAVHRFVVRFDLPVAGGERPVVLTARLQRQTDTSGDHLARWTDV
jgi:hypothetical protein